jgi:hypothetical protein
VIAPPFIALINICVYLRLSAVSQISIISRTSSVIINNWIYSYNDETRLHSSNRLYLNSLGDTMKLSYKDKQFLIETIEYRLNAYQEHLKIENLDEDEISDIGNDSKFLQSLCNDLTKSLNQNDNP